MRAKRKNGGNGGPGGNGGGGLVGDRRSHSDEHDARGFGFVIGFPVLGLHPEMVWASILARRKALLGPWYERWGWALPPKKPAQSERLPRIARAA